MTYSFNAIRFAPLSVRFFLLLLLATLLAGCERPFVEIEAPVIEIVSPSAFSTVRTERDLPLALRASAAVGSVSRVEVNGMPATFRRDLGLFLDTLRLNNGLNEIVVEAFASSGSVGVDTLFTVFLPARFVDFSAVLLPDPLGGHAGVLLPDGSTLITGGAGAVTEPAQSTALLFDPASISFSVLPSRLGTARTGHAASLLPDGRVLITGGSRRVVPRDATDLVTTIELYNPITGTFTDLPLVAADGGDVTSIRRSEHTVTVLHGGNGEVSVYLYGGIGRVGDTLSPLPFMRRLQFEDGESGPRLVAPNRSEGFRFAPTAGHTQTPLRVGGDGFGRYLIAGTSDPASPEAAVPFELEFASSFLDARALGPLTIPRTHHAASVLPRDLVLITGGLSEDDDVLPGAEVFADGPDRFFRFDDTVRLVTPRWGHTATNIGGDRILLVGGFSASGQATARTDIFVVSS